MHAIILCLMRVKCMLLIFFLLALLVLVCVNQSHMHKLLAELFDSQLNILPVEFVILLKIIL